LELAGDTGAVDKKVDPAELLKNTRRYQGSGSYRTDRL
jgi:hypothetical protein